MPRAENPYPGPHPFAPDDAPRFFGRDREIRDLASLILSHRVVLLYAPSGAGKTSLLNAGILPQLKDCARAVVVSMRERRVASSPSDGSNPFVDDLIIALGDDTAQAVLGQSIRRALEPEEQRSDDPIRVLMIDQFEDVFVRSPQLWPHRRGLFEQLASAVRADTGLRIVLAVREDFIGNLDPYASVLPGELRLRFRLEPLRPDAAVYAIEKPLDGTGRKFAPDVAAKLVENLRRFDAGEPGVDPGFDEFVEPVHLQVVCYTMWQKLSPDISEITGRDLQIVANVDEALIGFYETAIRDVARHTGESEARLRKWFAEHLITAGGTRGTVFADDKMAGGLLIGAVERLEQHRIIRPEYRARGRWYEIPHDRLVRPIRLSNGRFFTDANESDILKSATKAQMYGAFKVRRVQCTCQFDEDGSGVFERVLEDITVNQTITDLRVPWTLTAVADGDEEILGPEVHPLTGETGDTVVFEHAPSAEGETLNDAAGVQETGFVVIRGSFEKGSTIKGCIVRQRFSRSFQTRRQSDVMSSAPWDEYASGAAAYETAVLVVRVRFPPSHHALDERPRGVVFLQDSEAVIQKLSEEMANKVRFSGGVAELEIERPHPNAAYAIAWRIPKIKQANATESGPS